MTKKELFLKAIHEKKLVKIRYNSKTKGIITRKCVPFDYGPGSKIPDGKNGYHVCDLDSPDGPHVLSMLPENLLKIEIIDEIFEPSDYVKWKPKWIVKRDWGEYS